MYELPHDSRERLIWLEPGRPHARIELRGPLPVRWCNRLTAHLASRHIGVRAIGARREGGAGWSAWVELDGPYTGATLGPLGRLVDLEIGAPPREAPQLDDVEVESTCDHGGSVRLRFAADDRVGLLAAVFDALSMHTLFPAAIEAQTRGRRAEDLLWLKGLGNARLGGLGDEARVREALLPMVDTPAVGS